MTRIGYRGTPDLMQGLLSGQISATLGGVQAFMPLSGPGQPLKMLATTSAERVKIVADIPTFAELGYPELTRTTFTGIAAPAGLPADIRQKLHATIVKANADPQIATALINGGGVAMTSTAEEFDRKIQSDSEKWLEIIKVLDLKIN